ncbi:ATP-binding protein [Sphingomicrobium marinum]|uniref:ATP-binding protein n=1 Tax=Sphingomicrobium marinum TaxID=1227950 RepID=UPI00223EB7E9|nr:ATP-binding protein [Sphingomicrobium marinum]
MKRLTLATQIALVFALALFLAQAINFVFAAKNRQNQLVNSAALPAAERLLTAANNADALENQPMIRRMARQRRVAISEISPIPERAERLPSAERVIGEALTAEGLITRQIRVVTLDPGGRDRPTLLAAAQLEDGRWVSIRGRGPRPLGPLLGALILQYFVIGLIVLLPTLWLLRRTSRSMRRLTKAAENFDGTNVPEPVPVEGPRDVRALIAAVNGMETRIADMMGEKDVMLGAIGHDLRTPLTALRIEAETVEDESQRAALIDQIEALHAQFEQLLDFARLGRAAGSTEIIALDDLAKAIVADHADPALTLAASEPVRVSAQPGPLRRAIDNLVGNALRYGERAELSVRADGDSAIIVIRDHGPGIPGDQSEAAMRPFERLEASRNRGTGGHGLGLAIVAAVARAQGGRLELDDPAEGSGLEARIILPRLS